jgi:hypothetical protein
MINWNIDKRKSKEKKLNPTTIGALLSLMPLIYIYIYIIFFYNDFYDKKD